MAQAFQLVTLIGLASWRLLLVAATPACRESPATFPAGVDCMRSLCPVASVLDIIGDKWTLLVVRDLLFLGKRMYNELADSMEKIPTNILADRLKKLETADIIEKKPYQDKPVRYAYTLTKRGEDVTTTSVN